MKAWLAAGSAMVGLVACDGDLRLLDVGAEDDGWKLVVLVDQGSSLVRSLPPFRVDDGQPGRRLEVPVAAGVDVWLFDAEGAAGTVAQGRVLPQTLAIRPGRGSGAPTYEVLGDTRLVERMSLPDAGGRWQALTESGRLAPVDSDRLDEFRARVRLERTIETEPCPPPLGRFEPLVAEAPELFVAIDPKFAGTRVTALHAVDPETVLVLGEDLMVVVRSGRLPQAPPGGSPMPKDILRGADFPPRTRLQDLLVVGPDRYLVAGWIGRRGGFWEVELGAGGLSIVGTATVGVTVERVAAFGDELLAVDAEGSLLGAPAPSGPWEVLARGSAIPPTGSRLAAAPGRVAVGADGLLEVVEDGVAWPAQVLQPPIGRLSGFEVLRWGPQRRLWVGMDGGDLGVLERDAAPEWLGPVPLRMGACGTLTDDLRWPYVEETVRDLAFHDGWAFVLYQYCEGLWAFRREDRCAGVATPFGGRVASTGLSKHRLHVGHGRLFVGANGGRVSWAPLEGR